MASPRVRASTRTVDPAATLLYSMAALLLALYAYLWCSTVVHPDGFPLSPLFRIALLALVCLFAYLAARLPRAADTPDREHLRRRVRWVMCFCFVLYLHLVLAFTLFDRGMGRWPTLFWNASPEQRTYYLRYRVNLIPLHTIRNTYVHGYLNGYVGIRQLVLNLGGNFFVLCPMALLLPYLWRKLHHFFLYAALILCLVLLIEAGQMMLMCGAFDIDDILLNTAGALCAHLLMRIPPLRRLWQKAVAE